MARNGFLLVTMQPPPAFEEEFNAWYDSEHLPERLAVPGFLTALRYVATDGHPKYLAMYDLERFEVLTTPAYLKVAYDKASPWTKRVTGRVKAWRSAGHQVYPGDAITKPAARVLLARLRGLAASAEREVVAGLRAAFEARPEVRQTRVLAFDTAGAGIDYLAFVELRAPASAAFDLKALGPHAKALDLVTTFAPY